MSDKAIIFLFGALIFLVIGWIFYASSDNASIPDSVVLQDMATGKCVSIDGSGHVFMRYVPCPKESK